MAQESARSTGAASAINLANARRALFYLAVLVPLAVGGMVQGRLFPVLVTGWIDQSVINELGIHRLHVMSIALFTFSLLLLIATQLYRAREHPAPLLGAVVALAVGTTVMGVTTGEVMIGVVLGGPSLVALLVHPAGRTTLDPGDSYSPALLGLAVLAAVPLVLMAAAQIDLQFTQPAADNHAEHGHYAFMGMFALGLLVWALIAGADLPGSRIVAWFAGAGAAYFGLLSVGMVDQVGSAGQLLGAAAILWALAFVAVSEYSRRDDVPSFVRRERESAGSASAD